MNKRTKLTEEKVKQIKILFRNGVRNKDLAKQFNISPSVVGYIIKEKTWRHVKI